MLPGWLKTVRWQVVAVALVCGGIVHIAATLLVPHLATGNAVQRLFADLPANRMRVLPATRPDSQSLPFMSPDARYAVCRFDIGGGPIVVSALLPDKGWSFALYTPDGDNFYAVPAPDARRAEVSFVLVPPVERPSAGVSASRPCCSRYPRLGDRSAAARRAAGRARLAQGPVVYERGRDATGACQLRAESGVKGKLRCPGSRSAPQRLQAALFEELESVALDLAAGSGLRSGGVVVALIAHAGEDHDLRGAPPAPGSLRWNFFDVTAELEDSSCHGVPRPIARTLPGDDCPPACISGKCTG